MSAKCSKLFAAQTILRMFIFANTFSYCTQSLHLAWNVDRSPVPRGSDLHHLKHLSGVDTQVGDLKTENWSRLVEFNDGLGAAIQAYDTVAFNNALLLAASSGPKDTHLHL